MTDSIFSCPAECADDCTNPECGIHDERSLGEDCDSSPEDARAAWYHSQLLDNARLFRAGKIGRAEHDAVLDYAWSEARREHVSARLTALFTNEEGEWIAAEQMAVSA
jgi:hypothetical protein